MFGKKKKDKNLEFQLNMIEKIGTLELQNEYLHKALQELEKRVSSLEVGIKVGF